MKKINKENGRFEIQYSGKYVKDELEKYGYKLIGRYKKTKAKITIRDNEGYRHFVTFSNWKTTIRRNQKLLFVNTGNPYSVDNIKKWTKLNNKNYKLIECNEYKGNKNKNILLKCNICRRTWISFWSIMQMGSGCPFCSNKIITIEKSLGYNRPDLISEWDYSKNNKNPFEVFTNAVSKYWWLCSICGYSWETNCYVKVKTGCPGCNLSSGERRVKDFLDNKNIEYIYEHRFKDCKHMKKLSFDYYLHNSNVCIEYQGAQHYDPYDFFGGEDRFKRQIKNDSIKREYCENNNIKLIEIPYWDYDNVEIILQKELNLNKGGESLGAT
jgi:hypothetical protein